MLESMKRKMVLSIFIKLFRSFQKVTSDKMRLEPVHDKFSVQPNNFYNVNCCSQRMTISQQYMTSASCMVKNDGLPRVHNLYLKLKKFEILDKFDRDSIESHQNVLTQ